MAVWGQARRGEARSGQAGLGKVWFIFLQKENQVKDWEEGSESYILEHKGEGVELLRFTNDDDANVRCVFVRMEHVGELVSNYFMFNVDVEGADAKAFALKMVREFRQAEEKKES